ncbi:MAG: hypothetical protein MI806_28925, partial [Minwuiales bacterium]|nr:hypothetical protein [Minwuiales bacterium]
GRVAYARDAFDGLGLMDKVMAGDFEQHLYDAAKKRRERPSNRKKLGEARAPKNGHAISYEEIRLKRAELAKGIEVPTPPFWGGKLIERVDPRALMPYLNETMLYQFQWGFRKAGKSRAEYQEWAEAEVRPIMHRMIQTCLDEDILQPQAVYGYWPAAADGNELILFERDGETEAARFDLPRQGGGDGYCIADYFRDVADGERDVIGLQIVTMGTRASDVARDWFESDRYQDYLYLHGLGVEMAEALAEYVHGRIRAELGFGHEDARDLKQLLKQGYRGSRYSFGYPACPTLEDQKHLIRLLGAERIGIELAEEFQLHPEQSTSAIVVHHPKAKYFSV